MRKIKAIWRLIFTKTFFLYTSECFGRGKVSCNCEEMDMMIIKEFVEAQMMEVEQSLEYVKSLLTEI